MESQTFEPGDLVTWQYLLGGNREMSPGWINVMVDTILLTGSHKYKIATVENLPEDRRGGVGHHQKVTLAYLDDRPISNTTYSGFHFQKCS
jgi:hypothetical protein